MHTEECISRRELEKRISRADEVQDPRGRQEKASKELNGRREKAVKGQQVKGADGLTVIFLS